MPEKSRFPPLDIPATDLLTWLYSDAPNNVFTSTPRNADEPIWHDAANPSHSLSKNLLLSLVKRLGLGLERLGLKPGKGKTDGDVVLIFSSNHIFIPVIYFGAAGFGYVFSGVNPGYGVEETKYQITNTGAKILLVEPSLLPTALSAAEKAHFPRNRIFLFSDTECTTTQGIKDWSAFLGTEAESADHKWNSMTPTESKTRTAVLNYSSGTTGLPKGVMISHYNIISNTLQSLYMRSLASGTPPPSPPAQTTADDEVWLGFLPLYHAFGQLWSLAAAAHTLTPVYLMRSFDYKLWLSAVQTFRVTHIVTAPPILVMLAKRPETREYDLSSLRNILCGGAPLSRELQNEVMTTVGKGKLSVVQTCGATEATCSHVHVPGLMRDDSGSVGMVDPNCEVMLVDDEAREVGDGERGEIWVKGPNICLGYWRDQKATERSFEDGYWKSGDVAVKKDGWFWIVDRKKELIKVKGFQVAPAELEAALLEHKDVADAAVVALKIEHEERPRAYVSLKDDAKGKIQEMEIVEWMAQRVAKHKRLTGGVKFVDVVPKSPSGKIQRVIMREWAAKDARGLEGGVKARL